MEWDAGLDDSGLSKSEILHYSPACSKIHCWGELLKNVRDTDMSRFTELAQRAEDSAPDTSLMRPRYISEESQVVRPRGEQVLGDRQDTH